MAETRSLRCPQKGVARCEKQQIVRNVDPIGIGLHQSRTRTAGSSVHIDELEIVLSPIQKLNRQRLRVAPVDPGDVLGGSIDPDAPRRRDLHDSDADSRVRVSRFRVALEIYRRLAGYLLDDGIGRDQRLVHLEVSDPLAIGRPAIAPTHRELLLIDPVEVAVQNQLAAAKGDATLFTTADRHDPQVVLEDEGDRTPIGRELRVDYSVLAGRQRRRPIRGQVVEHDAARARKQKGGAIRRPEVVRHAEAGASRALALVVGRLARGRRKLSRNFGVQEHLALARRYVMKPKLSPARGGQEEAQIPIRGPANLSWGRRRELSTKDGLDGELLRRLSVGRGQTEKQENESGANRRSHESLPSEHPELKPGGFRHLLGSPNGLPDDGDLGRAHTLESRDLVLHFGRERSRDGTSGGG